MIKITRIWSWKSFDGIPRDGNHMIGWHFYDEWVIERLKCKVNSSLTHSLVTKSCDFKIFSRNIIANQSFITRNITTNKNMITTDTTTTTMPMTIIKLPMTIISIHSTIMNYITIMMITITILSMMSRSNFTSLFLQFYFLDVSSPSTWSLYSATSRKVPTETVPKSSWWIKCWIVLELGYCLVLHCLIFYPNWGKVLHQLQQKKTSTIL